MSSRETSGLWARADAAAQAVLGYPPRAALAREMRLLRRAEIFASTALAGSRLHAGEVDALLDRGQASGNHPLDDYILVRSYAQAAQLIADARTIAPGDPRPILGVDDIRALHTRATAGSAIPGGLWRQGNVPPGTSVVAPAAWLVPREVTALADRFGRGPGSEPVALWLGRFLGRFARLRPFAGANGRAARLAANLLLRRLDYPPLVFEQRDRGAFPAALAAAENRAPDALAGLIATAIIRACNRLSATAEAQTGPIRPLRAVAGDDYAALAKAAQRGRLRTIVRGGRYYTTDAWVEQYRADRRPAQPG
jgi:Fic family protein